VLLRVVGGSSLCSTSVSFTALRLGGILAGAPGLLMELVSPQSVLCVYLLSVKDDNLSKKGSRRDREEILQQYGQINSDCEARWCVRLPLQAIEE
jgi:hypothetical protein